MTDVLQQTTVAPATNSRLYRAIWRWHFYAGLFVVPFLLVLALTGLLMVWGNSVDTFLGPRHAVTGIASPPSLVSQAAVAVAAVPDGKLTTYVQPATGSEATQFIVGGADGSRVISIDPAGPTVVGDILRDDTLFNWASKIHGTLLLGDIGDRLLEVAAGLGILLVLTGLYMWWPRGKRSWKTALMPKLGKGRLLWKNLHQTTGVYFAIVLLFFLTSGLAWTGIWGGQIVQAWNTFPAEKFSAPLSDKTHASMNHTAMKEVPWALEETPMPQSGASGGIAGTPMGQPVDLDSVVALGRAIGFDGQFRVDVPQDDTGVFTISADSMNGDTSNPMGDRTVHVDQYSGKIIGEVGFADYGLGGKAMAVGIALHQANLGWWNTLLNTLFCLAVITILVSGVAMWWKRRPQGAFASPKYAKAYRAPLPVLVIGFLVCIAFPLTGIAIIAFAAIDFMLPRRLKEAGA